METKIGTLSTTTRTVPVTFTEGDVVHSREVNACFDAEGEYNAEGTEARVYQVAQGVAHKIAVGAIRKAEPVAAVEGDNADATDALQDDAGEASKSE